MRMTAATEPLGMCWEADAAYSPKAPTAAVPRANIQSSCRREDFGRKPSCTTLSERELVDIHVPRKKVGAQPEPRLGFSASIYRPKRDSAPIAEFGACANWLLCWRLRPQGFSYDAASFSFPQPRMLRMKFAAFTKSFQDRSIAEVCEIFLKLGLDGLDLTVRPGGHIDPANVAKELPLAVNAAHERSLRIFFLTTGITDVDPAAEALIAAAGKYGIDRIKLGYYPYQPFGTLARQLDDVRRRIAKVAALGKRHGVRPCIHIHSGAYIPSHGTLLFELIKDFAPDEIGAYVDPFHMTAEGGIEGWRQGLDLLAPWVSLVAIKNFAWERGDRDAFGQQRWLTKAVPLSEGVAPLPDFVASLKKLSYDGVYSLHSEYKGKHSFQDLDTEGCIAQTAEDLKFFRKLF
jgi:sugar phosphate isomerase/epimerase